ncbi:vWA domain-containing protein [Brevibacillus sp. SYSU BS000544]|uniref:vWA domain-containing protein n=1 Tax=Brevibacillus sp. SYSU BS000544 TaxID=3416443 RepID=UPI003CE4D56D
MISIKKEVQVVLEKKKLQNVVAKVGLVLDITGSMRSLYKNGVVQKVVERILSVAEAFDDNGELDVWVYDHRFTRLPSVTAKDFTNYVEREILNNSTVEKFGRNDEPLVMRDVLKKYLQEEPSKIPSFVVFINDGGVKKGGDDPIDDIIIESSNQPLFWQFVGIGNSDFGVLKKLDTLKGRLIDNANFFSISDIESISDSELYDKLLDEFPQWMTEAKRKGVL